jgi:hypothetical protein
MAAVDGGRYLSPGCTRVGLQTAGNNLPVAHRLDPLDLFVAKACAARDKDAVFNRGLLEHGVVQIEDALNRTAELEDPAEVARASAWIRRLAQSMTN